MAGSVFASGGDGRGRALRALLVTAFAAMTLLPAVMVLTTAGAGEVPLFTAMRILGLEAFTLIFVNIVTGALSRYFYRLFKPRLFQRFHIACGVLGFLMALAHGTIVIGKRYYSGYNAIWIIGPVTLGLLAITIFAAADKRRLPRIWRRIHQINYLIFAGVFVKALLIGSDLKANNASAIIIKILFIVYAVVASVATGARVWRYEFMARSRSSTTIG